MPYRALGSVLSFPFDVRNTLGKLANPDAVKIVLFADDVMQTTPGESVTVRAADGNEGATIPGLFFADADSSHEELVESGFYAWGKRYRAAVYGIEVDGDEGYGGMIPGLEIEIGVEPGSAGSGSQIVTLTVQGDDEVPIQGIRVTVYDVNGRFAGTGVSDENGLITLHLNPGTYALSSPSFPGAWQLANPTQSIVVTDGGSNLFPVEFVAMPITWPDTPKAAGWAVLVGSNGKRIAGASVFVVPHKPPEDGDNSEGVLPPNDPWEVVSDDLGRVLFGPPEEDPTEEELELGMLQGWEYRIWGETIATEAERAIVTVPRNPEGGAFPLRAFIRNTGSAA